MHADDALLDALRDALNHLYDPERLRSSPLIYACGLSAAPQPTARLQQILLDAIRAMQPPASEPAASVRRRVYNILRLRYEQQFAQKEVAAQLGLGVRQYRRLQQATLQALALQLTEQVPFLVGANNDTNSGPTSPLAPRPLPLVSEQVALAQSMPAPASTQPVAPADALPETLQWISKLPRDEATRVDRVLEDVLRLLAPLADRHGRVLHVERSLPASAAIPPMVLRQVLVNLLNAAILHGAGAEIVLRIDADFRQVKMTIFTAAGGQPLSPSTSPVLAELAIAQTMMRNFGGELTVLAGAPTGDFFAELRCPLAAVRPVMVVDDHVDTLDLLQRYLVDTPYTMLPVSDPQQVVELAADHQPCAILLDVMMPKMDGWAVLMQLRQDERTAQLPVFVCTILDQSELALSLGASGFLHKPVTRVALLAALDAHGAAQASAPG